MGIWDWANELTNFLWKTYGFMAQSISAANRGFYGETWKIHTKNGDYFVKIDYCTHHMTHYQTSLAIVQFMTENGISFIPQVIKTKGGELYSSFKHGIAAVFEYAQGEIYENFTIEQLYGKLAQIYQLNPTGITIETETFGTEVADIFLQFKDAHGLPDKVVNALRKKGAVISGYLERLRLFSDICKRNTSDFHITHGDVGSNCIMNDARFFIVDWDSVKLAPIERDAWIYIDTQQSLDEINAVLRKNNINYTLRQERLGFYCYYFYFHYLNEYLNSIVNTTDEKQKQALAESLTEYLTDGWIYTKLNMADTLSV